MAAGVCPDRFKTQEMCNKTVRMDPWLLKYVPYWFVTQQQVQSWHDDYYDDDKIIEWYEDHRKRKAQRAKIKEELLPIAWHPSRYWNWCMSEDEKRCWK